MEKTKYTFKQVAKWFINKSLENNAPLSKSKIHKLMYYSKGFYYVFVNEEFFENNFIASKNGPRLKDLSLYLKKYDKVVTQNDFLDEKDIKNAFVLKMLEFVYEKIAKVQDLNLEKYSMEEEPYSSTEIDLKINEEKINKYFREIYMNDDIHTNFEISREDILLMFNFKTLVKYDKAMRVLAQ